MNQPTPKPTESTTLLAQVHEGMTVYDRDGAKLGTVEDIYIGDLTETADERGQGPATASPSGPMDHSLVADFMQAVSPQEPMPEPIRQRLLRHGFIRIDCSGLFASDRYAMPDQIAKVSEDSVVLHVAREELVKH
jgi:hypothetical protein